MLSLGPMTIVEHILQRLRKAGIEKVYINLHYRGQQIVEHLGNGGRFGLDIEFLPEIQPLGTAGTVASIADRMGDDHLLVHYGDIVTGENLKSLALQHVERKAEATVLLHRRVGSNSFAYVDSNHLVTRFVERPDNEPVDAHLSYAFSGICALSPECVRQVAMAGAQDLPRDVFPGLCSRGGFYGVVLSSFRYAIDSPSRLDSARRAFAMESRAS